MMHSPSRPRRVHPGTGAGRHLRMASAPTRRGWRRHQRHAGAWCASPRARSRRAPISSTIGRRPAPSMECHRDRDVPIPRTLRPTRGATAPSPRTRSKPAASPRLQPRWRRASGPHLLAPLRLRLGRPRHRPHLDRRRHDPRRSAILPRRDTTWQQVSVDLTPFTGRDEVTVLFTVISDVVHREVKMRPRILAPFLAVTGEGPPHGRSL